MTYEQVYEMIEAIGVPSAYYQFPETGQATPFVCFYYSNSNDFIADDSNYQKVEHLIIELYTDAKDFELEAAVEEALSEYGMVWTRDENYIDSERMFLEVYETDVIITEGENNAEQD